MKVFNSSVNCLYLQKKDASSLYPSSTWHDGVMVSQMSANHSILFGYPGSNPGHAVR